MPMAHENQSVLEKISSEYYALTSSEKKTADFVLTHLKDTQFMSISELAEACGVAEATISRFCRRLGYKGYNAFKLAIANCSAQRGQFENPLSGEIASEDSPSEISGKLFTAHTEAISSPSNPNNPNVDSPSSITNMLFMIPYSSTCDDGNLV